jgi:hypothetical protein
LGPAAVLFALERRKLIIRNRNKLRLVRGGNVESEDIIAGYRLAGLDIQTTLSAVDANLQGTDPVGHSHIRTEYDNLYERDLPKVKKWINNQVRLFHRRTRKFLAKFDSDVNPRKDKNLESGAQLALTTASFAASKNERQNLDNI